MKKVAKVNVSDESVEAHTFMGDTAQSQPSIPSRAFVPEGKGGGNGGSAGTKTKTNNNGGGRGKYGQSMLPPVLPNGVSNATGTDEEMARERKLASLVKAREAKRRLAEAKRNMAKNQADQAEGQQQAQTQEQENDVPNDDDGDASVDSLDDGVHGDALPYVVYAPRLTYSRPPDHRSQQTGRVRRREDGGDDGNTRPTKRPRAGPDLHGDKGRDGDSLLARLRGGVGDLASMFVATGVASLLYVALVQICKAATGASIGNKDGAGGVRREPGQESVARGPVDPMFIKN